MKKQILFTLALFFCLNHVNASFWEKPDTVRQGLHISMSLAKSYNRYIYTWESFLWNHQSMAHGGWLTNLNGNHVNLELSWKHKRLETGIRFAYAKYAGPHNESLEPAYDQLGEDINIHQIRSGISLEYCLVQRPRFDFALKGEAGSFIGNGFISDQIYNAFYMNISPVFYYKVNPRNSIFVYPSYDWCRFDINRIFYNPGEKVPQRLNGLQLHVGWKFNLSKD